MRVARVAAVAVILVCTAVQAGGGPDAEVNPVTGFIESVDSVATQIRHTIDPGQGGPGVTALLTAGASDHDPRIAIRPDGQAWVAWWRDGGSDEVLERHRDPQTGDWSPARRLSAADASSRNPEIVHWGATTAVAFEVAAPDGTSVAVLFADDTPDPIGSPTVLDTTDHAGDLDVLIHAESGRLWVTWVASATDVGWSRYVDGVWTAAEMASSASDSVASARSRIRAEVLGP